MTRVGVLVHEGKDLGRGLEDLRAVLADLRQPDPPWYQVPKSRKAPIRITLDRTLPWEVDGGDRDRTDRYEVRCLANAVAVAQPWRTP